MENRTLVAQQKDMKLFPIHEKKMDSSLGALNCKPALHVAALCEQHR
jgi:hypothetical protein